MVNASEKDSSVLYYILNGYGVTAGYLIVNIATAILGIVIIYFNYLVMSTMIRRREYLAVADIYVISLAGADLSNGILLIYNTAYSSINYQSADECRFRFGLLVLVAICSGLHLLALAIDRCMKVMRPLQYAALFTSKIVIVICIIIWVFSLIIGLLPTFGWKNYYEETNNDSTQCTFFGTLENGYILLVTLIVMFAVVMLLIIYINIFKVAHRHAKLILMQQQALNHGAQKNVASEKQSWKFTKTISIIVGLYVLMWMPTGMCINK